MWLGNVDGWQAPSLSGAPLLALDSLPNAQWIFPYVLTHMAKSSSSSKPWSNPARGASAESSK